MNKRLFAPIAILATVTLLLSACVNPRAESAGVWYNPLSWGDQTLAASIEAGCADGATSTVVANSNYPCPGTETTVPPAAPLAPPVVGSCLRDGQTVADNPNVARTAMSYFGGTSEPCIFYGEVNFGLSKDGKGLTVLLIIPPQWTLNVNGMLGYAFWARESQGAVDWSISDSTANLTRSDGRAEATPLVIHVDNEAEMATLTSLVRAVYPSFAYKLIPPALP